MHLTFEYLEPRELLASLPLVGTGAYKHNGTYINHHVSVSGQSHFGGTSGIIEFDIGASNVDFASPVTLELQANVPTPEDTHITRIYGYAGDGAVTREDLLREAQFIASITTSADGPYEIDIAEFAKTLLENGDRYLGLRLEPGDPSTWVGFGTIVLPGAPKISYNVAASGIRLDRLTFNADRDGEIANASHRGVDFGYSITGSDLDNPETIEFYWGDESGNILKSHPSPLAWETIDGPIDFHPLGAMRRGEHRPNDVTFVDFNVPGRWGAAPPDARSLVAIIDPDNTLNENDADFADNIKYLPLHSAAQILEGSVQLIFEDRRVASARFVPGASLQEEITLSEAEIVLGVDHFNWRQQVVAIPPSWNAITLDNIFDFTTFTKVVDQGEFSLSYQSGSAQVYSDAIKVGVKVEARDHNDPNDSGRPFFDPLVLFGSGDPLYKDFESSYEFGTPYFNGSPIADAVSRSTRGHVRAFMNSVGKSVVWNNAGFGPYPDDRQFYYDVGLVDHVSSDQLLRHSIVGATHGGRLFFRDTPEQPLGSLREGEYLQFETQLVGVHYDGQSFESWQGRNTSFSWKSNTVKYTNVGGNELVSGGASSRRGVSGLIGGGVFGFVLEDGTKVPLFPETAPSIAGVTLNNGSLTIVGTDADDVIELSRIVDQVLVRTSFADASLLFALDDVHTLRVLTVDGNDSVGFQPFVLSGFFVDAGDGHDTVFPSGSAQAFVPDAFETAALSGIEVVDIRTGSSQSLHVTSQLIERVTDSDNDLELITDASDTIHLGDGWQLRGGKGASGEFYHHLRTGDVQVRLSNQQYWTNPLQKEDVDGSGEVLPLDALQIINRLNRQQTPELSARESADFVFGYYDVDGDGNATAMDALQIINFLSRTRIRPDAEAAGMAAAPIIISISSKSGDQRTAQEDLPALVALSAAHSEVRGRDLLAETCGYAAQPESGIIETAWKQDASVHDVEPFDAVLAAWNLGQVISTELCPPPTRSATVLTRAVG